jgi:ABC-type lipoprotein release transport system permease subunit
MEGLSESEQAAGRALTAERTRTLRPLAPSTYLLRNAGKTIPLTGVIMLAVLLVAGIISMINSIPYSIKTIYAYSEEMLGLGPRGDMSLTPKLVETVKKESPVPLGRVVVCRASSAMVRSIVGKWPFVVLGFQPKDMPYYLERMGSTELIGRLPKAGQPEAVVSEPVARNRGLKIGSALLKPDDNDNYSPFEVKVVGIAKTPKWIMFTDIDYMKANHFPPIDVALAFAKNRSDQSTLDHWAEKRFKGDRAQIFAYHQIEEQTEEMFGTLYKILNVVIGTLVLVITFMMGMLMNIYQTQRLVEFGLLQAIGYTRQQLLRRVLFESVAVIVAGWALGVGLAFGMLNVVKQTLMDPNAFALNTLDPAAYAYTIPLPLSILAVAVLTVVLRFRRLDPVSIVERRLV